MSDITSTSNRLIPIDTELYLTTQPDPNVVGKDDAEYRIQLTLKNKAATSPYTLGVSDISSVDSQHLVFTTPAGVEYKRPAILFTDGTDGIIFYVAQENDLNVVGTWQVRAKLVVDDVEINYPKIPFLVQ